MTSSPSNEGRHFKTAPVRDAAPEVQAPAASDVAPQSQAPAPSDPEPADGVPLPRRRRAGEPRVDDGAEPAPLPKLPDDPHAGLIKKRKKTHRKAKRRLRVAAIVLAALLVVVGGAAAGIWFLVNQGAQAVREASAADEIETSDEATSEDKGKTVEYNGTIYRYNENMVSIVVIGYDRRAYQDAAQTAGQADAVMVVAFDTQTGAMRVIGIPRDTMVDVDENIREAFVGQSRLQLALAFAYGDGYESSSQNVVRAVSRILYNVPMTYYFSIDMQGVGPLNDAVGGVTLTPLQSIPGTYIYEGQPITLMGNNALRYVQWRTMDSLTASLDRQARQSQYLQAFFAQAISAAQGNPATLVSLYQTATQYSTTNLGLSEFSYLASKLIENGMSQLEVTTLQGEAVQGDRYMEYELDETNVYETVLSVYYTPVGTVETDESSASDGAAASS